MDYEQFLQQKVVVDPPSGMRDVPELSKHLKPFQKAIVSWALRRGRAALFENTGLGKSLQQLVWADTVSRHTDAPILVLTPLAVAEQTVSEAQKFDIPDVAYAADARSQSRITITNYERFEKFEINDFAGVVLDESGRIKDQSSKTRMMLTEACKGIPWKLCCTATPAPNDYTELGQHAEFLDVMASKEMLSMFFVHDGGIRAESDRQTSNSDGWRLKRHAITDFWRWIASWAVVIRSPSDLGFDASEYVLPPLNVNQITVQVEHDPMKTGLLFAVEANTLGQRIAARRNSLSERVEAAVNLVKKEPNEVWLIWCNLNSEANEIEKLLDPYGAKQVAGSDPIEQKVDRLLGFKNGSPLILVSKPGIAGHGMNYQHCSRMIFVGLNDSFEQLYQAIRRCWRFGQTKSVDVYMIASNTEGAVVENLKRKERDFENMLDAMSVHMRDIMRENVVGGRIAVSDYNPQVKMEIPVWL